MNATSNEKDWEDRLKAGLGEAPTPDFAAWRTRHLSDMPTVAVDAPRPVRVSRRTIVKSLKWVAAASLLAGGVFWIGSGESVGRSAFAETIPGVDEVRTMTWTTTYYVRWTSADGKRTWIAPERRLHAYRSPGQYRETLFNEEGKPYSILITDVRARRVLELDLLNKKAVLKTPVGVLPDDRGPFQWVGETLRERKIANTLRVKSISLHGRKTVDKTQANVVRAVIHKGEGLGTYHQDFQFDVQSKQLVGIWAPNDDFVLETAPDRDQPAEKTWSMMKPVAALEHEIVVNPKLDPSDFQLDPPVGFTLETIAKPTVTEEEMIAYLGAAARFNDETFPDSPYEAFDSDKFNAASAKAEADRSAAEKDLIALRDRIMMREIYRSPVRQFEEDHTAPKSFCYVGSGVKVGQGDRIVLWYKPRNTTKYRAIYGDLSMKDVAAADLPLDLSK